MYYINYIKGRPENSRLNVDWIARLYGRSSQAQEVLKQIEHSKDYLTYGTRVLMNVTEVSARNLYHPQFSLIFQNIQNVIDSVLNAHPNFFDNVQAHYETFQIPKKSGGYRTINAPKPYLMEAMRRIKTILTDDLEIVHHNAAYAYCKGRGTKDALIVHQQNKSRWFLKLDIKNFFPNCNKDFIYNQMLMVHPFGVCTQSQKEILKKLIDFCLLDGGLPQGTPLSPIITNIIMTPIDEQLMQKLRSRFGGHFIYTRYADDLLISSEYSFNYTSTVDAVSEVLRECNAPFQLKHEKTRYGSSAGSNWNLGLMLNKDNNITIGHKQKQRLKSAINNFMRDFTNGIFWSTMDVYQLLGNLGNLKNTEPDYADYIVQELEKKYNLSFMSCVKQIV